LQLPPLWQITPLGVIGVVAGVANESGLRWLAHHQTAEHRRQFRRRSWAFYIGLLGLILVSSGPLQRWGMQWLSVHMIVHLLEMLYLPLLLIVGAPWVPLLFAVPVESRRRLLRTFYLSKSTKWLRGVGSVLTHPIVGVGLFNAVMVLWHVPIVFDWASWHGWVMNWLMAPSFVIVGLLFWRVILPSHPWAARGSTRMQIGAIVATAFEMLVLAMAMSIFTKGPWYSMNVLMDGPAAALRDQRWAAGILWVCGDFWAVPALVLVAMRVSASSGGVSASFERILGRA
jgi:cytochrome c oxidase assembly factor CtaG